MTINLQILGRAIEIIPARAAAFGAVIGGLVALMTFNLLGVAFMTAWAPDWAFMILAQAIGSAVAWATVSRRPIQR
jgi:ABC-type multidrug transport system permease subunit